MTSIELSASQLYKAYRRRSVVEGVSISVRTGEAVALLGPNGAGKTTCFYMLAGLIRPDKGEVLLQGKPVTRFPLYRRARLGIGYLPQESSVFRALTVEQNILAVLEARRLTAARRKERLEALLDDFSLQHVRSALGQTLSGGERRRTEMARALALEPRFLLLDEPLAGIDPLVINEIRQLIARLCQRGIGVLITDHNVRETLSIVTRAYVLTSGKVLASGKPEELTANPLVREHYLGNTQ